MTKKQSKQSTYEAERKAALELLERTYGKNAVIPFDIAIAVMPILPEYRKEKKDR